MEKKGIIAIIILVLLVLALGSFIIYDKIILNIIKPETAELTMINDTSIDLNSLYQIGNTLEKFDSSFNDTNSTYFGYIYKNEELYAKNFDKGAALYATVYNDLVGTNTVQYLTGAKVKNNFEKIFGKNLPYKAANINAGDHYNIIYDSTTNVYSYTFPTISNVYSPEYITANISTTLENDAIIVKRKVFYVEYVSNDSGTDITKASIYKNADKSSLIAQIALKDNVLSEKEVIAKYGSKLNTFIYTFKQNTTNDYSFYSIVRDR